MKNIYFFLIGVIMTTNIISLKSQDATINILHINDTHSNYGRGGSRDANLQGSIGGIAKATSVIGSARAQNPKTLVFHAGDFFMGDLFFYLGYGVPELQWMKMMEFDAITIGNHEFDLGTEALIGSIQYAFADGGVPLLSANLQANTPTGELLKTLIKDREIKIVDGVKVGYFGMTSPEASITSLSGPDIFVNDTVENIFGTVAEQVISLRQVEGAQLVIFISHLGMAANQAIAYMIPGIDIIISSHDHDALTSAIEITAENSSSPTYIVQAGPFFQNIGSITAEIKNGKLETFSYMNIPLDENIPDEPTVAKMIQDFVDSQEPNIQALFKQQIAIVEETLGESGGNPRADGDHTTDVGILIANALKSYGDTQLGFTTSGLSAQPLYKGPIVVQDIIKMIGYGVNETSLIGYNIAKFDITGAALKEGIKYCLNFTGENDEYLPQVAGMSIRYGFDSDTIDYLDITILDKNNSEQELDENASYSMTANYLVVQILSFIGIPISNIVVLPDPTEIFVVAGYAAAMESLSVDQIRNRVVCNATSLEDNKMTSANELVVFPNPAKENAFIELTINQPGYYSIDVLNIANLSQINLGKVFFEKGSLAYPIDIHGLASGNYIIRLVGCGNTIIGKMVICK